ncbi:MAG: DUF401 family protein [Candidatus Methanomethylicia archaeon]
MLEVLLLISILIVVIMVFKHVNVAVALGVGTVFYGVVAVGLNMIKATVIAFNPTMIEVLSALILAMFLASLLGELGVTDRIVDGLSTFGYRSAAVAIPAVIGLLPMPGGAYVSAVMTKTLYDKMKLRPQEEAFINYWFRHIWAPVWPLYQGIILASGILNKTPIEIVSITWPSALASVIAGLVIAIPKLKGDRNIKHDLRGLIHLWIFILISIFVILLRVSIVFSLIMILTISLIIYKPKLRSCLKSVKYALNPTIIILVIESLVFSQYIKESGIMHSLTSILESVWWLALFLIPFIIGLATGAEFTYVALVFPPLLPFLSGKGLLWAFLGGYMGVMLSPGHSCLILSTSHYGADIPTVYRYIVLAVSSTILITIIFSLF